LSGALVAGAAAGVTHVTSTKPAPPHAHVVRESSAALPVNPTPDLPHPSVPTPVASNDALADSEPTKPTGAVRARPADSGAATAREVALIDSARSTLRSGNGSAALRLLDDYEREFTPTHLEPEALYLRMQAAKLNGDADAARRAAARIATDFPHSPEASRADELLHAGGQTPKE